LISASKSLSVVLVCILAISNASLLMIKPVNAQSIPTPSVPQFTVKFVNASYSVTSTNLSTEKNQTELVANDSIEITINNQPFAYSNNSIIYNEYFNIRVKPNLAKENWTEIYPVESKWFRPIGMGRIQYADYICDNSPIQLVSKDTTVSFWVIPVEPSNVSQGYDITGALWGDNNETFLSGVRTGDILDFQVQALIGHNSTMWCPGNPSDSEYVPAVAYDAAGDWSPTQTVTMGQSSTSSTSSVPEFPALAILPLLLSVFSVAVIVRHRSVQSRNFD